MQKLSGQCLCGFISFTAKNPTNPHTCSCEICQKHTGSHTVVWLEFSRDDVNWTGAGGEPSVYQSSTLSCRAFCPQCGSSLGAIDDSPTIALLTGVFDNLIASDLSDLSHSYEDERPEWWAGLFF